MSDIDTTGELNIIKKFIKPKNIVFDVGANIGDWSLAVLSTHKKIDLYAFEPLSDIYQELKCNLKKYPNSHIFNFAISDQIELNKPFYYYQNDSGLSTLHRRSIAESQYGIMAPIETQTKTISIDKFCESNLIKNIDFLKIDTEGNELNVLLSAQIMFEASAINYIQFEYGGAYLDSKTTLLQIWQYISEFDFNMYRITPKNLILIKCFTNDLEDYSYCNFLLENKSPRYINK